MDINADSADDDAQSDEIAKDFQLDVATGQIMEMIDQMTALVESDFDSDATVANNNAVVDKMIAMLLHHSDGPQTTAQWDYLQFFGVNLASYEKNIAAYAFFGRLLSMQMRVLPTDSEMPHRLVTAHNLDNVCHQLVERWHFRMLNDKQRNTAYREAIEAAVAAATAASSAPVRVLDIGTGTGLLAMYAHKAGAQQVFACDDAPLMAAVARQIFRRNARPDRAAPVLIERHSTALKAADLRAAGEVDDEAATAVVAAADEDHRVDLIVTETLDAGAFGEGILQTLQHAHEHLLRPNGRVIPAGVRLYIAGFESRLVAQGHVIDNDEFSQLVYTRGARLRAPSSNTDSDDGDGDGNEADSSSNPEAYDSESVHQTRDFRLITRVQPAFEVDFRQPEDIAAALSGAREQIVRLDYLRAGHLDGFVVWFALQLDDERRIHTAPAGVPLEDGDAERCDCWEQAVFRLNTRFANTNRLKCLHVTVSCADGQLRVRHAYDSPVCTLNVPEQTVRFVNDAEYMSLLDFDVAKIARIGLPDVAVAVGGNVLDLCGFPHIGFGRLKDGRAHRLYCLAAIETLMRYVAAANCVDADDRLRFVGDVEDVWLLPDDVRFDLIVLAPIDALGSLVADQVQAYGRLRHERLLAGGLMLPHHVDMWGYLVRSEWLRSVTSVSDSGGAELVDWGIARSMNRFATRKQLGVTGFQNESLSQHFRMGAVEWGDRSGTQHETEIALPVQLLKEVLETDIHGLVCYYKVFLTPLSDGAISTRRFESHVRRICYVVDGSPMPGVANPEPRLTRRTLVYVRQHEGCVEFEVFRRGMGTQTRPLFKRTQGVKR